MLLTDIINVMLGIPIMIGLATYYDASPGALTRTEEAYYATSRTIAVDDKKYKELVGVSLLVVSEDAVAVLRVNDSGYLYRAGEFVYSKERDMFLPATNTLTVHRVVVDIPKDTFMDIFGTSNTQLVRVWRLGR